MTKQQDKKIKEMIEKRTVKITSVYEPKSKAYLTENGSVLPNKYLFFDKIKR